MKFKMFTTGVCILAGMLMVVMFDLALRWFEWAMLAMGGKFN